MRIQARSSSILGLVVAATLLGSFAVPVQSADDVATLTNRLRVLEDREAIRALITAYGYAHDHRDYKTFASLFASNGEWVGGLGTAKGPEAIFALMDKSIGHKPVAKGSGTVHLMMNDQIKIDGDRATAETNWLYLVPSEDGSPRAQFLGHYNDQFIREKGEWKFLRREAPVDIAPKRK
jgi:uncharacterized protein (TIGR02246 family)